MSHSERCKECKKRIYDLLSVIFGEVKKEHSLNLPAKISAFESNKFYSDLKKIFDLLETNREYDNFVRAKKLSTVDFFAVEHKLIVEFDESQHFTKQRDIALNAYPEHLKLGFDKEKWLSLCKSIHKKDNDPPFRDEQRAWYDTLKDFAPALLGLKPTVRLFAKDYVWCELDQKKTEDVEKFKNLLGEN